MGQEVDIPVKVVDRRRWAHGEDAAADPGRALKPTYVEELETTRDDAEKQAQEYLAKYRQASQEFEDARARMRKELAKDAERNRREVLVSLLEVVDNLDRAIEAAEKSSAGTRRIRCCKASRWSASSFSRSWMASASSASKRRARRSIPRLHEAVTTVPAADPSADGRIVGVIAPRIPDRRRSAAPGARRRRPGRRIGRFLACRAEAAAKVGPVHRSGAAAKVGNAASSLPVKGGHRRSCPYENSRFGAGPGGHGLRAAETRSRCSTRSASGPTQPTRTPAPRSAA